MHKISLSSDKSSENKLLHAPMKISSGKWVERVKTNKTKRQQQNINMQHKRQ